jgi:hypothetical protein
MTSARSQHPSAQSDHGVDILRSFKEWLKVPQARGDRVPLEIDAHGPSDRNNEAARKEFYYSPRISTPDPWIDQNPHQVDFEADATSSKIGRRLFRAAAYGFSIIVVVGVVVAWQAYGDRINTQTAWELSLSWPSLFFHTTGSDGIFPEVQNRLDTIASDLMAVRRSVEQLTSKQEQTTRDITMLQAAERNISQKISSLPHSPVVHVPPPKNVPSSVHSEASAQPSSVPAPIRVQLPLH